MTSDQDKVAEPRAGYLFCVSTPLHPERIHIGMTSGSLSKILRELNGDPNNHGGPNDQNFSLPRFKLEWSEAVDDILSVDLELEKALDAFRDADLTAGYFFCAPEDAHVALEVVLGRRAKTELD